MRRFPTTTPALGELNLTRMSQGLMRLWMNFEQCIGWVGVTVLRAGAWICSEFIRKRCLVSYFGYAGAIFAMLYNMEFIIYGLLGLITGRGVIIDTCSSEDKSTHVSCGPCLIRNARPNVDLCRLVLIRSGVSSRVTLCDDLYSDSFIY